MNIEDAISELRPLNEDVPIPPRLPTEEEVDSAERELGRKFPSDYRRYLLEASDVVYGTKEPCRITAAGYLNLVKSARKAWQLGVPNTWLPFCEDNGDYYCLDGDVVRYWSHDGAGNEQWADLGTWITDVWIGESE